MSLKDLEELLLKYGEGKQHKAKEKPESREARPESEAKTENPEPKFSIEKSEEIAAVSGGKESHDNKGKRIIYYYYNNGELWIVRHEDNHLTYSSISPIELEEYRKQGYIIKSRYLYRYRVCEDDWVEVEELDNIFNKTRKYYISTNRWRVELLKKKYGNSWSPWFDRKLL